VLGLVLRPCWPAGGVQSRPLKCCHAEYCSHRYGNASHLRLFACNYEVSPICVLGNFHGLEPEILVGAEKTDRVVCKSPTAGAVYGFGVGCVGISMAVHVSPVACMEPAKQRLHVYQEQEWRECVSLNCSSFNWDVSRAARRQPDSGVCLRFLLHLWRLLEIPDQTTYHDLWY